MPGYEYDEDASDRLHMDVVHETDESRAPVSRWVEAMRRLNAIDDPLARQIIALHRNCGSGEGECDTGDDAVSMSSTNTWGCRTAEVVADHFGVEYPSKG